MLHDLRQALRGLFRTPGFTAVAVVTLALGIGANTAVLTVARAVFSNPLPFADPDRLVSLSERRSGSRNTNLPVSGHEYAAWTDSNQVFDALALSRGERLNLTGTGEPEAIAVMRVSAGYLPLVGLQPALGRGFAEGDDVDGRNRVAILSDRLWRRRFAADDSVIGTRITLDDEPYTVVGVLAPLPASLTPDVLAPIDMPDQIRAVGRHNLQVIGRLRA